MVTTVFKELDEEMPPDVGKNVGTADVNQRRSEKMKGRRNARKHGFHSAKAALSEFGQAAIDGRSAVGRALADWRRQMEADLGGSEALSAQQHALLDVLVRTRLLLDGVDGFILSQKTIVLKRKKTLIPIVRERVALADSFLRQLAAIGLDKREPPVKTIREYIAERASQTAPPIAGADQPTPAAAPASFSQEGE